MTIERQIVTMLKFYGRINRPLTLLEIWRRSRNGMPMTLDDIDKSLYALIAEQKIVEYRGFFWIRNHSEENDLRATIMNRVFQDVCADEKWKKFILLRRMFRFLPFVEFVFASGSMAVGNAGPLSDFDIIVGAREGRIFTVRALCIAVFGLLGRRRKKFSHHDEANNKICLNHFVTNSAYRLSGPYNIYWKQLYKSLVPLFGDEIRAREFIAANDWAHAEFAIDRRFFSGKSGLSTLFEGIFMGKIGDVFEQMLRGLQQRRIEKGLLRAEQEGHSPRIKHTDVELEFHPDTKRIEEYIK